MAMTPAGMKAAIKGKLTAAGFDLDHPDTGGEGDAYLEAFAAGIVEYIQASAIAVDTGTPTTPAGNWPIT